MQVDEIAEGYYKVRLRRAGPWVPVHIWLEDGERDPDTWELLSDQWWKAEWAPRTDTPRLYPVDPFRFVNRGHPISKDEYQWLMLLRTFRQPSQRQLCKS